MIERVDVAHQHPIHQLGIHHNFRSGASLIDLHNCLPSADRMIELAARIAHQTRA